MFLNYISLLYIWKIVITSYIDIFTGKKFQHITIFSSFLMTEIDTKLWSVFKLRKSDLRTKISHRF